jgi:hypothetical protein
LATAGDLRYLPAVREGRRLVRAADSRRTREIGRADRRWFLIGTVVFGLSVALFFGARGLYRLTGPHPEVTQLLDRVKRIARWIIPRFRRPRKWQ